MINAASKLYTQIKNRIYIFMVDDKNQKICTKKYFDLRNPLGGLQTEEEIEMPGEICGFVFTDRDLE